jgi:hypothetical protein
MLDISSSFSQNMLPFCLALYVFLEAEQEMYRLIVSNLFGPPNFVGLRFFMIGVWLLVISALRKFQLIWG